MDKWIFELIGYSAHITDFFSLTKVPTYIYLKIISKVLIILFLFCLWGQEAKTNQKDFLK